jgi:hypothetical protein
VGSTDDLKRRFKSHQNGHVISTRRWRSVMLGAKFAGQEWAEPIFEPSVHQGSHVTRLQFTP